MRYMVDAANFKDLAEQNPEDVCKRALCRYDEIKKCYILSVWNDDYAIYPQDLKIDRIDAREDAPPLHDYFYVFIINYLLQTKERKICQEWISEKDIPGGSTFFRGPHEIPTYLISKRYSGNIEQFKRVCGQLKGTPINNMADAAYSFTITPRIPVAVLFWDGDDDFPPESKILYDKSIADHLALDVIFALAVGICSRIGRDEIYTFQ
ncbi:MAG: DUF3786 domain-containing protein [Desulfamplus sp.]|nr:DUF3786 domain-containing protein [Desulfamplus sp.]